MNVPTVVLETSKELLKAASYPSYSTADLFALRGIWRIQHELPERSERSRHEAERVFGRICLELGSPDRAAELELLESVESVLEGLDLEQSVDS